MKFPADVDFPFFMFIFIIFVIDYDDNGNIFGLHGTLQDITAQKLAEEALQKSEKTLLVCDF